MLTLSKVTRDATARKTPAPALAATIPSRATGGRSSGYGSGIPTPRSSSATSVGTPIHPAGGARTASMPASGVRPMSVSRRQFASVPVLEQQFVVRVLEHSGPPLLHRVVNVEIRRPVV